MDHETLAERYRSAFHRGDPESLRGLLVPDFTFAGPAATYHGIDVFVKASNHVRRIVKSVEVRTLFDAPDQTCAILTSWLTMMSSASRWWSGTGSRAIGSHPSRRSSTRGRFCAGPAESAKVAVDPVCHMSVLRDAAAATREHAGRVYHFCSEGCAIAFDQDPKRYLP